MKTSNKILIGIAVFLIFSVTSLLVAGRASIDTTPIIGKSIKEAGIMKKETRDVADFTKLSASSGINVVLRQGAKSVEVDADEAIMPYVKTKVDNGKLRIGYEKGKKIKGKSSTTVYVSAPELEAISASSGSDIKGEGLFKADEMDLGSSSSGDIDMELEADEVEADVSSGGSIKLRGSGNELDIDVSSGGNFYGFEFQAKGVQADASSGGHIKFYSSEKYNARASSGGNIRYKGGGSGNANTSSGGSVRGAN